MSPTPGKPLYTLPSPGQTTLILLTVTWNYSCLFSTESHSAFKIQEIDLNAKSVMSVMSCESKHSSK